MKKGISKKEIAVRGKLSAVLDGEASVKQVRQVLKDKLQNQSSDAAKEVLHEYSLIKSVFTAGVNNDSATKLPLRSEDFLAGVRAGIARLDNAPRLKRRRSFNWFWDWGLQPLAGATSLVLLVLIGVGIGADLMPADLGYASLNSSSQVGQLATRNIASNTASATSSFPTYVGKAIRANANNGNAGMVSARAAHAASGFGARGGFAQERLNAYKLDHANRKASAGFAPLIQMASYSDSYQYNQEVSGAKSK